LWGQYEPVVVAEKRNRSTTCSDLSGIKRWLNLSQGNVCRAGELIAVHTSIVCGSFSIRKKSGKDCFAFEQSDLK
jgi:hypothetical protein